MLLSSSILREEETHADHMKDGNEGGKSPTEIKTRRHSSEVGVRFVVLFKYIICLTEVFWYQSLSGDSHCHNFHFSPFWCITNKKLQKYTHYLRKVGLLLCPPAIPEDTDSFSYRGVPL